MLNTICLEEYGKDLHLCSNEECFHALMKLVTQKGRDRIVKDNGRKVYYISAEFLIGKLLSNNLINLGLYDQVEDALKKHGKSMAEIEEIEPEPSLGNGGLGRLAACFLDSIATLGLNGDGVGINYHLGLFKQEFDKNLQKEVPNPWIKDKSWLRRTDTSYEVIFGGLRVNSVMYEIDVTGYDNKCNTLKLFDIDSVDENIVQGESIYFNKEDIRKNLTLFLYPDDSDYQGQLLRIYQQYFMVSNAAQLIIDEAAAKGSNLYDLADYAVVQINDTHPTMVIPELIRLLVKKGIDMDRAIDIVSSMCAYTNHTILAEALEKWPIELFSRLLPRIYQIVEEINRRFVEEIKAKYPGDQEKVRKMAVIYDGQVKMAHLAICAGYSVNGVAKLHTEILEKQELKDFYEMMPEKFNNKTNGITQRRFLLHANPLLADWITDKIGDGWITDLKQLEKLLVYVNDEKARQEFMQIKHKNKVRLAKYIKEHNGIDVNPDSIFDVQVKRLHEYKRQLLNILHIMYLYNEIKKNPDMDIVPRTFIFGAKAAAGYKIAKQTIKLINNVAEVINNDESINGKIKVVFIENYRVSNAEIIFAAADVSEQISTASKEASGTGNMKFMLNGAMTLGTMDGANVEIVQEVGADNAVIFGLSSDEVIRYENEGGYDPMEIFNNDQDIREVLMELINGKYSKEDPEMFRDIYNSLLNTQEGRRADTYFILKDFCSYADAQKKIDERYRDEKSWAKTVMINSFKAGKFSSDRTIEEYATEIWKLTKTPVKVQ